MPHIVAGRLDDLPSDIRLGLGAYRYRIFVERLGWELPDVLENDASEWDQFDEGATVHLVALSTEQHICGCARLMPTTGRYLLRDVFPELIGPNPLPSSPSVWELSRFAGSGSPSCTGRTRDHRAPGMHLFPYAMAVALAFGATQVIGVVSHSVERLYRRFGLDLQRIFPVSPPRDASVIACAVELSPTTFENLHCNPDDLVRSIAWFGQPPAPGAPVRRVTNGSQIQGLPDQAKRDCQQLVRDRE
ncbi:acyl-homoserine-lactone synthase [Paraburkholderia sp. GAS42]|jgi:N-acyl-L-homoserine lactone synthetase|uniref:acyl-homoserine-lactone synthase n=1 Tax=Paraburkholderia sp. GAS42 TaxID=3035135 RepID=UPI003D1935C5